jgi:hypothetical protein
MRIKDYIDVITAISAAMAVSMIIVAFTEHFFQKKEQQDGRVQDIIIHGKLYNCEEAKVK